MVRLNYHKSLIMYAIINLLEGQECMWLMVVV